eukprot:CAMPEP_0170439300 /NCGR_PEP_ID=MMETSP0117_2-20130122/45703_1 /TAXON_ID=400756 /ORGANISM="Durinskia baltica, Strain CSIRO CS-38" /LENGTH=113 /DNA_ID=CAMNT_0010699597 /DNA_START=66 /DNA_END=402 /DNA_ORIENTATION=+
MGLAGSAKDSDRKDIAQCRARQAHGDNEIPDLHEQCDLAAGGAPAQYVLPPNAAEPLCAAPAHTQSLGRWAANEAAPSAIAPTTTATAAGWAPATSAEVAAPHRAVAATAKTA